jgi:hypothetical protein
MTAQALPIPGCLEGMACNFASFPGKVATGATGSMGDSCILIATGIRMATQAASSEQVVGQGLKTCGRLLNRNNKRIGNILVCTEMTANLIHLVAQGEMERMNGRVHYLLVAFAASLHHGIRMGRPSNQSRMSYKLDICFTMPSMTESAGNLVGLVEHHCLMTLTTTDINRSRSPLKGWGDALPAFGPGDTIGTEAQKKSKKN